MAPSLPKDHEDRIASKEYNSMAHTIWYTIFIPMPQAMKIPGCKSSSGQGIEEVRNDSSMAAR